LDVVEVSIIGRCGSLIKAWAKRILFRCCIYITHYITLNGTWKVCSL